MTTLNAHYSSPELNLHRFIVEDGFASSVHDGYGVSAGKIEFTGTENEDHFTI